MLDVIDDFGPVIQLSLLVERARGIRSMDIGRGADVFCAAFVDEGDDQLMSLDKTPCLNSGNVSSGRAPTCRPLQAISNRHPQGHIRRRLDLEQGRVDALVKCTMPKLLTTLSTMA